MFIKESNRKINSDLEEHLKEFPHLFSLIQKKSFMSLHKKDLQARQPQLLRSHMVAIAIGIYLQ